MAATGLFHAHLGHLLGRDHVPRESRRKRGISFWREWTVNYGRYCPPVNNSPPHYMWELLTLDRLAGTLCSLSLSVASFHLSRFSRVCTPGFVASALLYFTLLYLALPYRRAGLPRASLLSIREPCSCVSLEYPLLSRHPLLSSLVIF